MLRISISSKLTNHRRSKRKGQKTDIPRFGVLTFRSCVISCCPVPGMKPHIELLMELRVSRPIKSTSQPLRAFPRDFAKSLSLLLQIPILKKYFRSLNFFYLTARLTVNRGVIKKFDLLSLEQFFVVLEICSFVSVLEHLV